MLFLLLLHPLILSGVISPLFSSSILSTSPPGEFTFQCLFSLPFHTIHGVLKARILKVFAIPFSSGPHFVSKFGKGQFSFQSQRRAMPKNVHTTTKLHSSHMLAKQCAKFQERPDVQTGFRKGRGTRGQIANIRWII